MRCSEPSSPRRSSDSEPTVNCDLNDEQRMLADATGDLLDKHYEPGKRQEIIATDLGWNRTVWKMFGEMGLLGLPFPEEDGGTGAGPVEVMAVMTEIGRRLAPEPYLDSVVLAGGLVAHAGSPAQRRQVLSSVVSGGGGVHLRPPRSGMPMAGDRSTHSRSRPRRRVDAHRHQKSCATWGLCRPFRRDRVVAQRRSRAVSRQHRHCGCDCCSLSHA